MSRTVCIDCDGSGRVPEGDGALDVRATVFYSLNNAEENGFFEEGFYLHGATVEAIVDDLKECDAECEAVPAEELIPHVEAWLAERAKP